MNKVLLVEDNHFNALGITSYLNECKNIKVVAIAPNGKEALDQLLKLKPDIIVTKLDLPEMSGVELIKKVQSIHAKVKVLVFSSEMGSDVVVNAVEQGANGYLSSKAQPDELEVAIHEILNGNNYFGKNISDILIQAHLNGEKKPEQIEQNDLSKREIEILQCIARGLTSSEIGGELYISTRTVDTHRNNIIKKLHVKNTAQLITIAHQRKLIQEINLDLVTS